MHAKEAPEQRADGYGAGRDKADGSENAPTKMLWDHGLLQTAGVDGV
jgi:hypothetical protein